MPPLLHLQGHPRAWAWLVPGGWMETSAAAAAAAVVLVLVLPLVCS
jgi:hypothetical protein